MTEIKSISYIHVLMIAVKQRLIIVIIFFHFTEENVTVNSKSETQH